MCYIGTNPNSNPNSNSRTNPRTVFTHNHTGPDLSCSLVYFQFVNSQFRFCVVDLSCQFLTAYKIILSYHNPSANYKL